MWLSVFIIDGRRRNYPCFELILGNEIANPVHVVGYDLNHLTECYTLATLSSQKTSHLPMLDAPAHQRLRVYGLHIQCIYFGG